MTSQQAIQLYQIALKYTKQEDIALQVVNELEIVIDNKPLLTEAYFNNIKNEFFQLRIDLINAKADILKWALLLSMAQVLIIIIVLLLA